MRVPATPRPSPTRGAQIAAAMRFPAADAGHPGHRSGAHDTARSARDALAGEQRLLSGHPQFICFAGAPLVCPRPIRLKDARTCAAVRRRRLLGAAAQPSRPRAHPHLPPRPGDQRRGRCRRERPSQPSAEVRGEGRQGFVGEAAGRATRIGSQSTWQPGASHDPRPRAAYSLAAQGLSRRIPRRRP